MYQSIRLQLCHALHQESVGRTIAAEDAIHTFGVKAMFLDCMGHDGSQIGQHMPGDLQVLQGKVCVLPYLLCPAFASQMVVMGYDRWAFHYGPGTRYHALYMAMTFELDHLILKHCTDRGIYHNAAAMVSAAETCSQFLRANPLYPAVAAMGL
jgi:hypothetical protein